jgi:hypothetical protein
MAAPVPEIVDIPSCYESAAKCVCIVNGDAAAHEEVLFSFQKYILKLRRQQQYTGSL